MSRNAEMLEVMIVVREANGGILTGEAVREAARPKNHPFHNFIFDKAPKEAAEAYYLARANELIRSFTVEFISSSGPTKVRRYASMTRPDYPKPVYEDITEVADDPLKRKMLLNQMHRDWAVFKARYEHLEEFFTLIAGDTNVA